jgi:hypothetical protein
LTAISPGTPRAQFYRQFLALGSYQAVIDPQDLFSEHVCQDFTVLTSATPDTLVNALASVATRICMSYQACG